MQTMKVKPWGEGQGDHVLIDVNDFDDKIHTPFEQATQKEPELTVAQIKAKLDENGVKYAANATKADLLALLG